MTEPLSSLWMNLVVYKQTKDLVFRSEASENVGNSWFSYLLLFPLFILPMSVFLYHQSPTSITLLMGPSSTSSGWISGGGGGWLNFFTSAAAASQRATTAPSVSANRTQMEATPASFQVETVPHTPVPVCNIMFNLFTYRTVITQTGTGVDMNLTETSNLSTVSIGIISEAKDIKHDVIPPLHRKGLCYFSLTLSKLFMCCVYNLLLSLFLLYRTNISLSFWIPSSSQNPSVKFTPFPYLLLAHTR